MASWCKADGTNVELFQEFSPGFLLSSHEYRTVIFFYVPCLREKMHVFLDDIVRAPVECPADIADRSGLVHFTCQGTLLILVLFFAEEAPPDEWVGNPCRAITCNMTNRVASKADHASTVSCFVTGLLA